MVTAVITLKDMPNGTVDIKVTIDPPPTDGDPMTGAGRLFMAAIDAVRHEAGLSDEDSQAAAGG
jgi:hypothetical protein